MSDEKMLKAEEIDRELLETREGLAVKGETLWSVYWRRFKKHTLGKIGAVILILLYAAALFADFLSPYDMTWADKTKSYHPPSRIFLVHDDVDGSEFRPYVYEKRLTNVAFKKYSVVPKYSLRAVSIEHLPGRTGMRSVAVQKDFTERKEQILEDVARYYRLPSEHEAIRRLNAEIDRVNRMKQNDVVLRFTVGSRKVGEKTVPQELHLVKGNKNFIRFFAEGIPYSFWGLFTTRTHFFSSPTGGTYFWGADASGRDLISRLLHGSRVSLSVGIIGALISFTIGLIIGGIAGYFGGKVDNVLMRFSEIILSFPRLYLLLALRATFPASMSSTQVYFIIIIIISMIGWATLARTIRGLVLAIKSEDFVLSARTMGLSNWKIIRKHVLPNTLSYVIVSITIAIPTSILAESGLSFLGLGINEPQSSWGLMLAVGRNYRVVRDFPWILIPGFAIFIAIMAWNFFGDGVRDAVDPKSKH